MNVSRDLSHTSSIKVLTDLLARLEAAEGADRELEFAFSVALGEKPKKVRGEEDWKPDGHAWSYWPEADRYSPPKQFANLTTFGVTASLDASLALVERCGWRLNSIDASIEGRPSVMLKSLEEQRFDCEEEQRSGWTFAYSAGSAKTPALALLCALVKALIAANADTSEASQVPGMKKQPEVKP